MSFAAKYPGTCGECGRRFQPGDQVEYQPGDDPSEDRVLVALHDHADSALLAEVGRKPSKVCARCFMVHAGECL
jgi:hypothetical protein